MSDTLPRDELEVAADAPWAGRTRLLLAVGYAVLFVQQAATTGVPFDRWRLLAWILGALAISCVGRSWTHVRRLVLDWVPFLALLVAYSFSARLARFVGLPVQRESILWLEQAVFGGSVPSVVVQHALLPDGPATPVAWWEVGVSVVYASHFVVPYVLAGWLWVKDRTAYVVYVIRFSVLTALAVATFVVLPTAPPWMLSDEGLIAEVFRPVGRGWQLTPIEAADTWLVLGRRLANPVAAMPSLHTGFAVLVAVTLWPRVRARAGRVLLACYPLAMGFVLVYGAEHWVLDVVAGAAFVALAVALARTVARSGLRPAWLRRTR